MDLRKELKKRRSFVSAIVRKYEGMGNPIPQGILTHAGRMACLPMHLASGSQIDYQFHGMAIRNGLDPVWISYQDDVFQSCNQRKTMYLHVFQMNGSVNKLVNPEKWNGKRMSDIVLDSGKTLIDYHLEKWKQIPGRKFHYDLSEWLQFFGDAEAYYEHAMMIEGFLGVSFWPSNIDMYQPGEKQYLLDKAINPAISSITQEYGMEPLRSTFALQPFMY